MPVPKQAILTNRDTLLILRVMNLVIRSGALQNYQTLVQALGGDSRELLRRNHINPDALRNPDTPISLTSTIHLLEESAAATRCPDFGLRLAGSQDPEMLGPLAIVIQSAPNIAQAVTDASRYLFLHSPAYEMVLDQSSALFDDCVALRFGIRLPEFIQQRQILDGCLGLTYRIGRLLSAREFALRGVSLPHSPIAEESVYRRYFGVPAHFAQPYAALHVHRDVLKTDLKAVSPALRQLALDYIARRVPPRTLLLSDRVRQTLTHTMGAGKGTKAEIAALLGMHPRTLLRRLALEGVVFEEIREEIYKQAALRFLCETDIPLTQLAGALGFSEPSALTRSCRRWFGHPPSTIRAQPALVTSLLRQDQD